MPWSPAQSRNRSKASSGVSHGSGAYTYETTMDEMIEECAPRMAEAMGWTVDESASLLGAVLPTLKRWRGEADGA